MEFSLVIICIQLGLNLIEGWGVGLKLNIGKMACEEFIEVVKVYLENNCCMFFIIVGMGGGIGMGVVLIIVKIVKEMDIFIVGIVMLFFIFEGCCCIFQGFEGLEELKKNVDILIVIFNDKLWQIYGNLFIFDVFVEVDDILIIVVKGIVEIIIVLGYVNVDFEDVNIVMCESGVVIMGIVFVEGEDWVKWVVDDVLYFLLFEDNDICGVQYILFNIIFGMKEVIMDEIFEIIEFVQEEVGYGIDLIWGNCYDEELGEKISVMVIVIGFEYNKQKKVNKVVDDKVIVVLDEDQFKFFVEDQLKKKGLVDIGYEFFGNGWYIVEFDDVCEIIVKY